jgi:hypothetical protein
MKLSIVAIVHVNLYRMLLDLSTRRRRIVW